MVAPEFGPTAWRKSSRSSGGANNCVEVAHGRGVTALRDSKNAAGPVLVFRPATLVCFLDGVQRGTFDVR